MKNDDKDGKAGKSQVVDLANFRKQKEVAEELTRGGRSPLYVSHMTGKVTGNPHMKRPESPDFGDRLQRIRSSLEKINRLMTELKKMSADGEEAVQPPTSKSKS